MRSLPTGVVTFLFTDIEGSTRLVQELGADYSRLLDEHCTILRRSIADAGGTEVGTEGDSFFAVFPSASAALEATVAAQRELAAHRWPSRTSVRVRMGLHTGQGTPGGDNYIGLDVHRAARIAAAGHGGQIVMSSTTRSLIGERQPEGITVLDLGAHRLKDLANPEHLYQASVAGLATEFPELRSLDARPNNLPQQLSSFVGREAELAALRDQLANHRLVTLTGPGGTGKTRLALQAAAEQLGRHGDGVFFVELAAIDDPALVPAAIAGALRIREVVERPLTETLIEHLRDRELLLVLDNYEHVLAAARVVSDLLAAAPRLRVLVTSRAPLHMRGEVEHPVPPLAVPDASNLPALGALSAYEGVALFIDRAVAVRSDFAVDAANAPAIAEIVARLDGLPLGIELAAAKVRLLGPEAILGRLGSRLAFLGDGARDLPARQRTLREAIDWSFNLLPNGEKQALPRLGVFPATFDLEAASAILASREATPDSLEVIGGLVDQSLLRREPDAGDEPRFSMLETIHDYAVERLASDELLAATRRRHAEHFLARAEAAEPALTTTPAIVDAIERDHDNFRAALNWACETGEAEIGLRLGHALWRFWQERGHFREGRDWFDRLLALPGAAGSTAARAKGLTGAAGIAYWQNDYGAAIGWYREAEDIIRRLGDRVWLADAIYNLGTTAALVGDMATVAAKLEEGASIGRELGNDAILGRFLQAEGYMAFMGDDLEHARRRLEEALEVAERGSDRFALAVAHHTVGQVARLQARVADAARHYGASLGIGREHGEVSAIGEPLQGLAALAIESDGADAVERGVRWLGAYAALRDRLGGGPPPEWLRLGDPLAAARSRIGKDAVERAWQAGQGMAVEAAVDEAIATAAELASRAPTANPR